MKRRSCRRTARATASAELCRSARRNCARVANGTRHRKLNIGRPLEQQSLEVEECDVNCERRCTDHAEVVWRTPGTDVALHIDGPHPDPVIPHGKCRTRRIRRARDVFIPVVFVDIGGQITNPDIVVVGISNAAPYEFGRGSRCCTGWAGNRWTFRRGQVIGNREILGRAPRAGFSFAVEGTNPIAVVPRRQLRRRCLRRRRNLHIANYFRVTGCRVVHPQIVTLTHGNGLPRKCRC